MIESPTQLISCHKTKLYEFLVDLYTSSLAANMFYNCQAGLGFERCAKLSESEKKYWYWDAQYKILTQI